jgi:hypothetical protein
MVYNRVPMRESLDFGGSLRDISVREYWSNYGGETRTATGDRHEHPQVGALEETSKSKAILGESTPRDQMMQRAMRLRKLKARTRPLIG